MTETLTIIQAAHEANRGTAYIRDAIHTDGADGKPRLKAYQWPDKKYFIMRDDFRDWLKSHQEAT